MNIPLFLLLVALASSCDARRSKVRAQPSTTPAPAPVTEVPDDTDESAATNYAALRYNYKNGAENYRGPDSYSAAASGPPDNDVGGLIGLGQLAASIKTAFEKHHGTGGSSSTDVLMSSSGSQHGMTSASFGEYHPAQQSGGHESTYEGSDHGGSAAGFDTSSGRGSSDTYSGHGGSFTGGLTVIDGPKGLSQGSHESQHNLLGSVGSQEHGVAGQPQHAGEDYKSYIAHYLQQHGGTSSGGGSSSSYPSHILTGYRGSHSGGPTSLSVSAGYKVHGSSGSSSSGGHSTRIPGTVYGSPGGNSFVSVGTGPGSSHGGHFSSSGIHSSRGPSGVRYSTEYKGVLRPSQVDFNNQVSSGAAFASGGGHRYFGGYGGIAAIHGVTSTGSHGGIPIYGSHLSGGHASHPGIPAVFLSASHSPAYAVAGGHHAALHPVSLAGYGGHAQVSPQPVTYDVSHLYASPGGHGAVYGGTHHAMLTASPSAQVTKQVVKFVKVPVARPVPVAVPQPVAVPVVAPIVAVPYKPVGLSALKTLPVEFEKPYSVTIVKRVPKSVQKEHFTIIKRAPFTSSKLPEPFMKRAIFKRTPY